MRRVFVSIVFIALFFGLASAPVAHGQDYPVKPIDIMCMLPPGSSMDLLARLVADTAPKYLGQPFVVINKPGAGGAVAAMDVINSKPDGYKFVTLSNNSFISTFKTQKIMFNPDDLINMWTFLIFKTGLFVRGDAPWKTLDDLLNDARKNPDKISWGHHGRGLSVQVAAAIIFKKAGVKMIEIPHKGPAESMAALLGGHIDVLTTSNGSVSAQVASGKIRCLVVYNDKRFSDRPDIPCTTELGHPEIHNVNTFVGLYGHKDTPEKIKRILKEGFKKTCEDPAFKAGIEKVGEEHRCETPEFTRELIKKGDEVVTPILKELGIYVERK